jgi:hypothetical protein
MAFIKGKQIKDASVLTTKLSGISSTPDAGDILVTGASGVLAAVTVSGDATLAANGALTIASGAIETAMVNANVITGQTAEATVNDADLILIYDASASALRKMTRANFTDGLGGGGGSSAADDITTGDAAVTIATSSGNITIDAQASDSDIIFKGTDGGSDITMLTLDGSDAGAASFNSSVSVGGALTVTGNLTVNGTTTTVNSTTVTVDDPIFTLGGDAAPSSDDNKDRGIEFRWHNGTAAKAGFFGFDDSTGRFSFIPDATNSSEVFSGTLGDIDINALYIGGTSMVTSDGAAKVQSGVAGYGIAYDSGALKFAPSELGATTDWLSTMSFVLDDDGIAKRMTRNTLATNIVGGIASDGLESNSGALKIKLNGSSLDLSSSGVRAGTFQKDDLGQTVSSNVTADNTDTGLDITNTPNADQIVRVEVNGVAVELGDGVKTKTCYFSGDSGSNARAMGDIAAGDSLYWNGSSVYSLETDDIVDFIYSSL